MLGPIDLSVVEAREDDVIHGTAGRDAGNQPANQHAGDRRIAIGKMIDIGLLGLRAERRTLRFEPGQAECLARRHRIDAHRPELVGAGLEECQHVLVRAPVLLQKIAVAHVLENGHALPRRLAGQHVAIRPVHLEQLRARRGAQGKLIEIGTQRDGVLRILIELAPLTEGPAHQAVDAEDFLLEENAVIQLPARVELLIERGVEALDVDAEILEQSPGDTVPIVSRTIDRLGTAVADEQLTGDHELVALGVTAEIVVGVQDENAGLGMLLPVEVRCRQAADAGAHHDQVVAFLDSGASEVERPSVAQPMCRLERTDVAAAQAVASRRIGRRRAIGR